MYSIYKVRDYVYSRAHGRSSSRTGFKPPREVDWLNAHSIRIGSMRIQCGRNQCALNAHRMRIRCPVWTGLYTGSNCPGISGTVPDLLTLSLVSEGFTASLLLVPDVGQTAIITETAHLFLVRAGCAMQTDPSLL